MRTALATRTVKAVKAARCVSARSPSRVRCVRSLAKTDRSGSLRMPLGFASGARGVISMLPSRGSAQNDAGLPLGVQQALVLAFANEPRNARPRFGAFRVPLLEMRSGEELCDVGCKSAMPPLKHDGHELGFAQSGRWLFAPMLIS